MSQRARPAPRAVAIRKSGASRRMRVPSPEVEQRLEEALEQQKATAEILSVISGARSDVQPVFETIAAAALRLCKAVSTNVFTFDGELIHLATYVNTNPAYGDELRRLFPRPPNRDLAVTRAMLTGEVVQIPDVSEDPDYMKGTHSRIGGFRSNLAVPLLRDGRPIGAVVVGRPEPGLFPDTQVSLLQTFADQAVIAIENVRLFNEVQSRNRDLTEALEQQMATSEILRVISQSPTDVQPVFDTIAAAALKLCSASSANVFTYDGTLVHLAALVNLTPAGADAIRSLWPRPLSRRARRLPGDPDVRRRRDPRRRTRRRFRAHGRGGRCRKFPQHPVRSPHARGKPDRRHRRRASRGGHVSRKPDHSAPDLRRPGRHRDRERTPLQRAPNAQSRADRRARARDRDRRRAAR